MSDKTEKQPSSLNVNATPANKPTLGSYEDFEDTPDLDAQDDPYLASIEDNEEAEEDEDADDFEDEDDEDYEDDDDEDELEDDDEDALEDDEDAEEDDDEDALEDDEEDDEDYEDDEDDEDYEDDEEEYSGQLSASSFLDQLSSSPLFAQVSQMLTAGMDPIEKAFTDARMLQASGDLEGAAQVYLDVLEENPDHFKANVALGQVLMAMDKPQEALPYLSRAVEIDPEDASGYLYLGYAHYALEQFPECIAAFQRTVELEPDNHLARNNLGFVQYLTGDLEGAAHSFTISADHGSDRAFYNLGMVRLLQGREKEGWSAYQEAFDLDPRMGQIEDHLQDLDKAAVKYPQKAALINQAIERLEERLNGDDDEDEDDEDE